MGTIVKIKGVYKIRYDLPPAADGKRRQKTESCRGLNTKQRKDLLIERESAIRRGVYVDPSKTCVSEYLRQWLGHAQHQIEATTHAKYAQTISSIIVPRIGMVPLDRLSPMHLQTLYSDLLGKHGRTDRTGPLSPKTVANVHGIIHAALTQAVRMQMILTNPADSVDPPKCRRPEINVATPVGWQSLLQSLDESPIRIPLMLIMATGMRRGECCGLQWQDVDWAAGKISIRRAIAHIAGQGTIVKGPKTDTPRLIPLNASTMEMLRAHQREQVATGMINIHGYICTTRDGSLITPNALGKQFARLRTRIGVNCTLHGLRHTVATDLLRKGVPVNMVALLLGHSTPVTTMGKYAHVIASMEEHMATVLEEMMQIDSKPETKEGQPQ